MVLKNPDKAVELAKEYPELIVQLPNQLEEVYLAVVNQK